MNLNKFTVAIVILNENEKKRTDNLVAHILGTTIWPYRLIVVDNGSDTGNKPAFCSLALKDGVHLTNGFRMGLYYAKSIEYRNRHRFFAYWLIDTSIEFRSDDLRDPLEFLARPMAETGDIAMISPSFDGIEFTSWNHMRKMKQVGIRRTWVLDGSATLYNADWFDKIDWINPELRHGLGCDVEVAWKARKDGRSIMVNDEYSVIKSKIQTYKLNGKEFLVDGNDQICFDEMTYILERDYGRGAAQRLIDEYR